MNNPVGPDPHTLLTTVGGGRITRIYTRPAIGVLFTLWTYLCGLIVSAMAPRILAGATRDFVVMALPLLTLLLAVGILYFVYRASDEYLQHRMLKAAAFTGVILAFSTTVYFGLEQLGFPQVAMIAVILYGWVVFAILLLWAFYRG